MDSRKKFVIFQIDAFTSKPFEGNPAGVTFSEEFSDEQMQMIAREMNLSETAFISSSQIADYRLRWFTPLKEVDLCGHATIASLHYLNELGKIAGRDKITFETRSGVLSCPVGNDEYFMEIPPVALREADISSLAVSEMLRTPEEYISGKHPYIRLASGYLYVYCSSLEVLKNMTPDFRLVSEYGLKYNFNSVYVFTDQTFDPESTVHGRFFAPLFGIDEDPVTGSANGPLMIVLKKLGILKDDEIEITKIFEQGDIIGRRGRVTVKHSPMTGGLFIGGNAVTIIKGELNL